MPRHATASWPWLWIGYFSVRSRSQLPHLWVEYWVIKQAAFLIKGCEHGKPLNGHLCNGSLFSCSWIDSVSFIPYLRERPHHSSHFNETCKNVRTFSFPSSSLILALPPRFLFSQFAIDFRIKSSLFSMAQKTFMIWPLTVLQSHSLLSHPMTIKLLAGPQMHCPFSHLHNFSHSVLIHNKSTHVCFPRHIYHKALLLFIYVVCQQIVNFLKADTMFHFSVSPTSSIDHRVRYLLNIINGY